MSSNILLVPCLLVQSWLARVILDLQSTDLTTWVTWGLDCQQPAAAGGFTGFEASLHVVPCKSDVVKHAAAAG